MPLVEVAASRSGWSLEQSGAEDRAAGSRWAEDGVGLRWTGRLAENKGGPGMEGGGTRTKGGLVLGNAENKCGNEEGMSTFVTLSATLCRLFCVLTKTNNFTAASWVQVTIMSHHLGGTRSSAPVPRVQSRDLKTAGLQEKGSSTRSSTAILGHTADASLTLTQQETQHKE